MTYSKLAYYSHLQIGYKGSENFNNNQKNYKIMAKKSILTSHVRRTLEDLGHDEIMRYVHDYPNEIDYNIAQFGNLLIYYDDIRELMEFADYKVKNYTNDQVWNYYKHIVREVVNKYFIR